MLNMSNRFLFLLLLYTISKFLQKVYQKRKKKKKGAYTTDLIDDWKDTSWIDIKYWLALQATVAIKNSNSKNQKEEEQEKVMITDSEAAVKCITYSLIIVITI